MTKEEVIKWAKKEGYKDKDGIIFKKEGDKLIILDDCVIRESKDCMNKRRNLYAAAFFENLEVKNSILVGKWIDIKWKLNRFVNKKTTPQPNEGN